MHSDDKSRKRYSRGMVLFEMYFGERKMSWHCALWESSDEEGTWVQIQTVFIGGGIPISFVAHAECLDKAICNNATNIHDNIKMCIEDIKTRDKLLSIGESLQDAGLKIMKQIDEEDLS